MMLKKIAIIAFVLSASAVFVNADSKGDRIMNQLERAQEQNDALKKEIKDKKKVFDGLKKDYAGHLKNKKSLQATIDKLQQELDAESQSGEAALVAQLKHSIDSLQQSIAQADSLHLENLKVIQANNQRQKNNLENQRASLEQQKAELEAQLGTLEGAKGEHLQGLIDDYKKNWRGRLFSKTTSKEIRQALDTYKPYKRERSQLGSIYNELEKYQRMFDAYEDAKKLITLPYNRTLVMKTERYIENHIQDFVSSQQKELQQVIDPLRRYEKALQMANEVFSIKIKAKVEGARTDATKAMEVNFGLDDNKATIAEIKAKNIPWINDQIDILEKAVKNAQTDKILGAFNNACEAFSRDCETPNYVE